MRACTITLSMPGSTRVVTRTLRLHDPRRLSSRCADVIAAFANSRGVSTLAVEYSISYGRA
jgi:hypothetical protein